MQNLIPNNKPVLDTGKPELVGRKNPSSESLFQKLFTSKLFAKQFDVCPSFKRKPSLLNYSINEL